MVAGDDTAVMQFVTEHPRLFIGILHQVLNLLPCCLSCLYAKER